MDELREKNKVFHHNMITKQEASGGLDDTHPGAIEEDIDEEIVYKPPFLGSLRGGDKWITLPAYEPTHRVGEKVMSYTVLC